MDFRWNWTLDPWIEKLSAYLLFSLSLPSLLLNLPQPHSLGPGCLRQVHSLPPQDYVWLPGTPGLNDLSEKTQRKDRTSVSWDPHLKPHRALIGPSWMSPLWLVVIGPPGNPCGWWSPREPERLKRGAVSQSKGGGVITRKEEERLVKRKL